MMHTGIIRSFNVSLKISTLFFTLPVFCFIKEDGSTIWVCFTTSRRSQAVEPTENIDLITTVNACHNMIKLFNNFISPLHLLLIQNTN